MDYIFRSICNWVYTEGMFFLQSIMFYAYFDLLILDIFTRVLNAIYVIYVYRSKMTHTLLKINKTT